jgi:hypothetical protein
MHTFVSKYTSYSISLPSKTRVKFQNYRFSTKDTAIAEELRSSSACNKDYSEIETVSEKKAKK